MKTNIRNFRSHILALALIALAALTPAQGVTISDPGLEAAIRAALQKPNGPLSQQDLLSLTNLDASSRKITNVAGLEGAHNLVDLDLDFNNLQSLSFLPGLNHLSTFDTVGNQLTNLTLAADMTNLTFIGAGDNLLANFTLPADLNRLNTLSLSKNELTSFTLPSGLTNLGLLFLGENQLTNITLPSDLNHLTDIDLGENELASLTFPSGMTNLNSMDLDANQLVSLALPTDMNSLTSLFVDGNPFTKLVLSENVATNLAQTTASLQRQGIAVVVFPLQVQLISPRRLADGEFEFALTGPLGVYTVLNSPDLLAWSQLGFATNTSGTVRFLDTQAGVSRQKFYRARSGP